MQIGLHVLEQILGVPEVLPGAPDDIAPAALAVFQPLAPVAHGLFQALEQPFERGAGAFEPRELLLDAADALPQSAVGGVFRRFAGLLDHDLVDFGLDGFQPAPQGSFGLVGLLQRTRHAAFDRLQVGTHGVQAGLGLCELTAGLALEILDVARLQPGGVEGYPDLIRRCYPDETLLKLDALRRAHLQESPMDIHRRLGNTVLMITHVVDEAVLLSDRIVMMTNGPAATIGQILPIDLSRPRRRVELADNPTYNRYRAEVLRFLHSHDARDAA